ncbi:pentatricopeptide repeat-containing protein At3g22150, chloroplastic-like [Chenopodium quinoa]|uniref:pentatricopeptide repeat-containing protein At3g22150, chloroplastic-like n=1 Tax=Chenopodium quinoa TaxID=63459 RepID=UPI000B788245|nr:pentatricopeptide repeat-containing protein At3g22150, chloroplastic-like [Chenopodium quinoa]XP_021728026.1 pentatricopeptide repeat-containing protein At3g22150, chloroplastic-like [Chenopodium quinoa]
MSTSSLPLPLPLPPNNLSPHRQLSNSQFSLLDPLLPSLDEPQKALKTPTIRTRLSQLCRDGQPHIARQVFDALPKPTTVVWNTIIIGFICNNLPFDALLFYSRMRSNSSTKCDSYTYSSVLKACADTRNLRVGKAVHCHVIRSHIHASRIVYNSLLNMYSTCLASTVVSQYREVDPVRRVFKTMKKKNVVAWNTLISWFVKTERFDEAVRYFRLMLIMGIKPTPVSFVNVFPAVSGVCDYRLANVLYGMLVKFGGEYVDDLYAVSSAIVMFSDIGCLDIARKMFDGCLNKNVEVWNSMIGGYLQNNCYIEALDLFVEALSSEHVSLDNVSYISALNTVSQMQQMNIGQQLHALVLKNPTTLSVTVLNAVIVMYSRCNYIHEAFKVFEGMVERDAVSWNTMITALVQNGLDDEGLMLVYEMQNQGFVVDAVTVIAILSAASNLRSEFIGKQTHAYLIRKGIEFQGMDSYLIDMYAKSGLIEKAQLLFEKSDELSRDQATWNSMVSSNTQNGLIEEAFAVFRQMLKRNVLPNAVTMASILPACSQIGSIALGKQIHAFATRHTLDQNVFVGTALVDMYSKLGAIASAENMFALIPTKSPVTYTNMILGYGQHGMGARALALFDEMQSSGVKPDAVTFIAVLSACSYAGMVDEGLSILESMEIKYGLEPSIEHYACVVDMLGRDGRLSEAFELAEQLGEVGSAIQAWGSLLAACKTHRQYDLAKIVADKLLNLESRNSRSGYHVLLSNLYSDEGYWDLADRVRKEMQERGERKEVGCSWIETLGRVNYFVSKDVKHLECEYVYEMLAKLASNMEDAGYTPLCYGDTQMD